MDQDVLIIHGPPVPLQPVVLDSPHSGRVFPADFDAIVSQAELRDREDSFIDTLFMPAVERGIPLLAAQFPRTYLDPNRHADDIDLDLMEDGYWPVVHAPSGKARTGKALIWRLLDDERPIYGRRLSVAEVQARVARYHQPYHAALRRLIAAAHAAFGVVVHINCHSMHANTTPMVEGTRGRPRADFVLGDRDGSTCDPELTELVRAHLAGCGYDVGLNDPFKGVELVRAYSDPAGGRHSLQIEVNKRLYMDEQRLEPNGGFAQVQADLLALVDVVCARYAPESRHA